MNITFMGSINSSYKRGKDKTKRKRRGLLSTGIIAATGGLLGAKAGSELAQTGLLIDRVKRGYKKVGVKIPKRSLVENITLHKVVKEGVKKIREEVFTGKKDIRGQRHAVRLLNKARKIGGIRGAVIGATLAGGAALAINKLKNRKD